MHGRDGHDQEQHRAGSAKAAVISVEGQYNEVVEKGPTSVECVEVWGKVGKLGQATGDSLRRKTQHGINLPAPLRTG